MKLIIDDGNIENIKEIYEYFEVDGVTTNPSILAKQGKNPKNVLKEIREFIKDDELHIQVLSNKASDIEKEARIIVKEFGENTFIKIPSNKEGFKAMRNLVKEGINVTATAIYSPMQAFLAMKAGAKYVAPYVNRIDNLGYDGLYTVKKIQNIIDTNGFDTEILAASFKNSNQALSLIEYGIGALTCSADVIRKFVDDRNVDKAVDDFAKDFEKLDNIKKTMIDYLS
ncbi:fructose-6-phosphate aldolase [Anaerococcus sp. AGMB00486]|uniref:Fructose-6-phosphate aldolase n=2 Tax=Anaerococcus TaxID=165779 RepID=A0ABX2NBH1_9FIRM|nr:MULTISPECIES: transaldolase family protein [Anaerococcus]MDY3006658.1 transaldolase family protein [Anaerococcus porci]MSS78125.1 fructose-6-phosphate aldolase [Anaerococcus porci]NVF12071.1 fructose-6-phosphate aldolase [Anaerococcus faecalis]